MPSNIDPVDTTILVVVLVVLLTAGTMIVNPLEANRDTSINHENTVVLDDGQTSASFGDTVGTQPVVRDSTGYAVALSGANDSYVTSEHDIRIASDDTWTVSTWASLSPDATASAATAVSVNGRVVLSLHNQSGSYTWQAWYYSDSTTNSYQVNVSAAGQPGALGNVQVVSNGTHLAIYQNNTRGEVANLSESSLVEAPVTASNWHGRLEELRTFDTALNNSTRQALVDTPIAARPSANPTARAMFDEPGANRQLLLYTDSQLVTSNVSYQSGLAGSVYDRGSDYEWDTVGPQLTILDSGALAEVPVVYVSWMSKSKFGTLADDWRALLNISGLLIRVLAILLVISYFLLIRGR